MLSPFLVWLSSQYLVWKIYRILQQYNMTHIRNFAIIGLGPRGGYALEQFVLELAKQNSLTKINISLFESTGNFGNGQVYDLDQNPSNWINISERILELQAREAIDTKTIKVASFPSYHEWIERNNDFTSLESIDTYPPRSKVGKYLSQRFQTLVEPLMQAKIVSQYKVQVTKVKLLANDKIQISTNDNIYLEFDEILLTIGHQTTERSKQIKDWEEYSNNNAYISLFKNPYPTIEYLKHKNLSKKSVIGVRGFGLAMIDVVRAIANKFGRFEILVDKTRLSDYRVDDKISISIVPFSLDGLPPVPKPLNAKIDGWFTPTEDSMQGFKNLIGDKEVQANAVDPKFLIEAFAPIAADVYLKLSNTQNTEKLSKEAITTLIKNWLEDQGTSNALFIPHEQPALETMNDFVKMACGQVEISLDYCIGQVWRHCQPTIYKTLSFSACPDTVIREIIALDESTKRYSYGPPVESIQQLIALEKAGVLKLQTVKNPAIEMKNEGWEIKHTCHKYTATIMIDSVLDAPKIKAVVSPLVKNLLEGKEIEIVHADLGVETDEYGYLILKNTKRKIPVALLGRLAKGTIIGVDAILECFGDRPTQWAKKASGKHKLWLYETQQGG